MNILNKAFYYTWNIGFVDRSVEDIIISNDTQVDVHWVKHNYKDRFFADPFILSVNEKVIKVLVEDFPYYDKYGMISLLTIDRQTFELLDRKVVLKQPFHMSYPFIMRKKSGDFWVSPEASMSGKLYRYSMNPQSEMLENQSVLVDEPLLDSTIVENDGKYWLFCTKRGADSNKCLYIYYSDTSEGPWESHTKNPVVTDLTMSRPAGYMVKIANNIYRVIQKCDITYGEAINISRVVKLSATEFEEEFVKEIRAQKDEYSHAFHTMNGLGNLCVVDGVRKDFAPFRRFWYEAKHRLKKGI